MRALVTGGGGFLGSAITRQLLERGDEVTILARGRYPAVEALGASAVQHDLCQRDGLDAVVADFDVIFHVAARVGFWGPREDFWSVNVDGTRNLLDAAAAAGVARFVFTSSPSVTFAGEDEDGGTEETSHYPDSYGSFYPESKAEAERLVMGANGPTLATTCLRPHLIYGENEPNLIPRLIDRAASGRVRIIGEGRNKVGFTYVENAAAAHLQAADRLAPDSANAGKAYFITDGPPVVFWDFANDLLTAIGHPPVTKRVSYAAARRIGGLLEWTWRTFSLNGEPPLSRFVIDQLARAHWWDLGNAKRDFGYAPPVDPDTAFQRTVESFRVS